MLNAYQTIRNQLETDICAAWGVSAGAISWGLRIKPRSVSPSVTVILSPITRNPAGGRSRGERFGFLIVGEWSRDGFPADVQSEQIRLAKTLGERLVPSSPDGETIPASTHYADVGNLEEVTKINCYDLDDTDDVVRVGVAFELTTYVVQ